ncbi:hypothetical protein FRC12_020804, partial [Ceratobasidium sp. 428]
MVARRLLKTPRRKKFAHTWFLSPLASWLATMRNVAIIFGVVMMVQGQSSMPMSGLVELAPNLMDCADLTTGDHHTPAALSPQALNR